MYYTEFKEGFLNVLKKCQKYIQNHDMYLLDKGQHLIQGEDFYVNILEYTTRPENQCIGEAHEQYLDVHYIIEGEEYINVSNIVNMEVLEYNKKQDYLNVDGVWQNRILLRSGILLLLDTVDAHKTGIQTRESCFVKKAVFKIKL